MSPDTEGPRIAPCIASTRQDPSTRFLPRPAVTDWPTTRQSCEKVLDQLSTEPFFLDIPASQKRRVIGVTLLLSWLADQPGQTWQQRWLSSGADNAGAGWRAGPRAWLEARGHLTQWREALLGPALTVAVCADVVRPSLSWLVAGATGPGSLVANLEPSRDPEGFARLRKACESDPGISATARTRTLYRGALIIAAKGGSLAEVTVGDIVELLDAEADGRDKAPAGAALFYRIMRQAGILEDAAPISLSALRAKGQRSPDELIDRYQITCVPVRDLLVDYLRERQPRLDHTSLESLAYQLGKLFWADIEAHHPGIDSLALPADVASAWKRRLRSVSKTTTSATGDKVVTIAQRVNYRECLTPVRAFYLDLAEWAREDPARWGAWVAPCPVGREEVDRRKELRQRKSRMDARTRKLLPALPALVRAVDERRRASSALLDAASRAKPGQAFADGTTTLIRTVVMHGDPSKVRAEDPITSMRRDLSLEEDYAFWAWAIVEVLQATGVRIEELLELSHHSLVQYRLPDTAELVPLLQIAPSKTDAERLLVVSPELADILSTIIVRVRGCSARSRSSLVTTVTNACGRHRRPCCSSVTLAPSDGPSPSAASGAC